MTMTEDFDDDFAPPGDWARLYRRKGLQVVPAFTPGENPTNWKRPLIKWQQFEHDLIPEDTFNRWYGTGGEHATRQNMGLITGACSGGVFVVDLDLQKEKGAAEWWLALLTVNNNAIDIETPVQTTGGGGKQMLFRAPVGWIPPTCKTAIGVDIRGQGGFAMLPPSRHASGQMYDWDPGKAPWNIEIEQAPDWLCEAIDELVKEHGGIRHREATTRTASPAQALNEWGKAVDGREDYMTRIVWGSVLDWWRECPIRPPSAESEARMREVFQVYLRKVETRLQQPGVPKHVLLEHEGRGITAFTEKWNAAIKQWDGKVAKEAATRPPDPVSAPDVRFDPETGEIISEAPAARPRIELVPWDDLPDIEVQWLIKDFLPAGGFAALYGKPGSYKSFVALYVAACVGSQGLDAFGRQTQHGDVVYIAGEGGAGLRKRRDALVKKHSPGPGVAVHFIRAQLNLRSTDADAQATIEAIRAANLSPALVIIDTLARAFGGGNENASEDMGAFIAHVSRLQEALGGPTIMIVHHCGKDEARGLRGHSSLLGAVDTELEVVKLSEDDSAHRIGQMTVTKQKDGEDGFKLNYRLDLVELGSFGQGEAKSSLALVPDDNARPSPQDGLRWPDKDTCNRVLKAIDDAWRAGRPWTPSHVGKAFGTYAPENIMKGFNLPRKLADEMLGEWQRNGVLTVDMVDAKSKKRGLKVLLWP